MSSSRSEGQKLVQQVEEYLTFFIAEVEYAISLEHVREVIPYDTITRVPAMPDTVRGVTNLRGSVVPVIDLAIKFRLPAIEITPRTCIVLVETTVGGGSLLLGLLTEEVGQVLAVPRSELLPPPSFGTPVHSDYLEGMLPIGKKFALVLQIERTLSQDEILSTSILPEADAEAAGEAPEVEVGSETLDDDAWEESTPAGTTAQAPAQK